MAGQIPTGTFAVRDLVVTEPPGALEPSVVIPKNGPFSVKLTFQGTGAEFIGYENLAAEYKIEYFAEGYGVAATEKTLGTVTKSLIPGRGGLYMDADTELSLTAATNDLTPGVYELAALVTFPKVPAMAGHIAHEKLISITVP